MNKKRKSIIMGLISLGLFLGFLPIIFIIDGFFKGANFSNYQSWIEFLDFEMYLVFMMSMSYIGFRTAGTKWKKLTKYKRYYLAIYATAVFLPVILSVAVIIFFKLHSLGVFKIQSNTIGLLSVAGIVVIIYALFYYLTNRFLLRWKYAFLSWSIFFVVMSGFFMYMRIIRIGDGHSSVFDAMIAGLIILVISGVFLFDYKIRRLAIVTILGVTEGFMILVMLVSFFVEMYSSLDYKRDNLIGFVGCEIMASRSSEYRMGHTEVRFLDKGTCISQEIACQIMQEDVLSRGNTLKVCHDKYRNKKALYFVPSKELSVRILPKYDDEGKYTKSAIGGMELTFLQLNSQFVLWDNELTRRFTEVKFGSVAEFLGGQYLTDSERVYYGNRPTVTEVDIDSFEYLGIKWGGAGCAKDKNNVYYKGAVATQNQRQKCLVQ
jgi:hypothetical protein